MQLEEESREINEWGVLNSISEIEEERFFAFTHMFIYDSLLASLFPELSWIMSIF